MENILFELTNNERKYLGLLPVEKNWELIKLKDMYLYFDGDIIRKKITVSENQYLEQELLEKTARAHPDKTFVFVGPRTDHLHTSVRLEALPNVLLTGPKHITELPAFLRHFDCTIIPFLKNNLTGGIYPLKINEYLAAGKAVVTTNFSEDIRSFAQVVSIAEDHEQFIKMIDSAVKDNSESQKQKRLEVAQSNSWEKRAELFWDLAWNAYLKKKQS